MKTVFTYKPTLFISKLFLLIFVLLNANSFAQTTAYRYDSSLVKSGLQNTGDCSFFYERIRGVMVVTNSDSSLFTQVARINNSSPFLNEAKQIFALDSNRRIISLTDQYGDSLNWINNTQRTYSYDTAGKIISTTIASWSDFHASWVNSQLDSTQFSSTGLTTRAAVYSWDTLASSWYIVRSDDYAFNANDQLLDYTNVFYSSIGSITSGTKHLYSYNANGKLLSSYSIVYNVPYSYWKNVSGEEYYYDAADRDTMDLTLTGDSVSWIPNTKHVKILNGSGLVILNTFSVWTSGMWMDQSRTLYDYNVSNLDSLETTETFDGTAWTPTGQSFYTYSPTNRVIEKLSQSWDGTAWVNSSDIHLTYDIADSLTETLSSSWVNGAWQDYYDEITSYSSYFPLSYTYVLKYYSVNDGWQTVDEQGITYDTAGNVRHSWFDGHAGMSGGEEWYDYYPDGTLYHQHGYGCSMGGLGSITDIYYYHLLQLDLQLNSSTVCPGDTLTPVVTVSGDNPPFSYLWSPGAFVSDSSIAEPYLIPTGPTDYFLSAYDDSGSVSIREIIAPVFAQIPLDLGPDTLLCTGVTYILDAGNQFSQYEWQDNSSASSFSFTAGAPGVYDYWVVVTDSNSCRNSDSVSVTVDACSYIEANENSNISAFPNPSNEQFCLDLTTLNENADVVVYNSHGVIVKREIINPGNKCVVTKNLPEGIYYCSFKEHKNSSKWIKIVINH